MSNTDIVSRGVSVTGSPVVFDWVLSLKKAGYEPAREQMDVCVLQCGATSF